MPTAPVVAPFLELGVSAPWAGISPCSGFSVEPTLPETAPALDVGVFAPCAGICPCGGAVDWAKAGPDSSIAAMLVMRILRIILTHSCCLTHRPAKLVSGSPDTSLRRAWQNRHHWIVAAWDLRSVRDLRSRSRVWVLDVQGCRHLLYSRRQSTEWRTFGKSLEILSQQAES